MDSTSTRPRDVGVVVIGRNEGERLMLCLESLERSGVERSHLVYADSGSTDGSVERVRALGIHAIATEAPFTAAKGRNAGFTYLTEQHAGLFVVQFVDGDCEYFPSWIEVASDVMRADASIVAVTGVQHERHPEASIYNLLCEVEWAGVPGEIDAFAGNAMVRVDALQKSGLFDATLIAGEDPELSIRVKKATGGRIMRIDEPICLHDADMTKASQWWKRNVRTGHAYAQVSAMHGEPPLKFWKKETRSIWLWGAVVPLAAPALVPPAFAYLFWKVYVHARARGVDARKARVYAFFVTVGKVPEAVGQATYWWNELRGRKQKIIEYRRSSPS